MNNSSLSHLYGFPDRPITSLDSDMLEIAKYVQGLVGFIRKCQTPMTIAIQGDWGTGKTSMMNLIKYELTEVPSGSEDIHCIWFNTWQFSQLNMADELPLVLLSSIVEEVVKNLGNKGRSESVDKLDRILKSLIKICTLITIGTVVSAPVARVVAEECGTLKEEPMSRIDIIKDFRNTFREAIRKICDGDNGIENGKIVFFIDDLDRMAPDKAVEVLEVIKVFLDCDRCVFVLAIDYDVVSNGFKKKYGDSMDKEKGRNFFDKIIQVPFKLPVTDYKIEKYIKGVLNRVGFEETDIGAEEFSREIISHSIGLNPRGMMRLFNLFSLLQEVSKFDIGNENILNKCENKEMLLSILCMQQAYEECYSFFAENRARLKENTFKLFREKLQNINANDDDNSDQTEDESDNEESIDFTPLMKKLEDFSDDKLNNCMMFFESLEKLMMKDNKSSKSVRDMPESRLDSFKSLLGTSIVTTTDKKSGKGIRNRVELDELKWHSLDEPNNWDSSIVSAFKLMIGDSNNEEVEVKDFADLMVKTIDILEDNNSETFNDILKSPSPQLKKLFEGGKRGAMTSGEKNVKPPHKRLKCGKLIDTKTNSNTKIKQLRELMERMGYEQKCLEIQARVRFVER